MLPRYSCSASAARNSACWGSLRRHEFRYGEAASHHERRCHCRTNPGNPLVTVKLSLGLDILGNILGALAGTKLDVSAGFQGAFSLTFEFADVTVSSVSIILLDKYLNLATIDATAKQIKQLMQGGKVAVTTSVARTKKCIVSAQDDHGVDIKADVPVIKSIASGSAGVSTTGKSSQKVVVEGPDAVTFGVQAAQLRFDKAGQISALNQMAAGSGAVLGMSAKHQAAGQGKPNLVKVRSRFIEIE